MPGGIPVTSYLDFARATGPFTLTSAEQIINEAAKQKTMFRWALKGRKAAEMVQGGQYIQDIIFLRDKATFANYKPGDSGTPTNPQLYNVQTEYWKWSRDYMVQQDEVVELNAGELSESARLAKYKSYKRMLNQAFWTSYLNGMDGKFWANPHGAANYAAMEGPDGLEQKSILSFVNEDTTNRAPLDWTNIHGIAAKTTNYYPQVRRYDYSDPHDDATRGNGLFDAFQRMHTDLQWTAPGMHDELFTESDPRRYVVFCSKFGYNFYCKLCREANNVLRSGAADPGVSGPNFLGTPIEFHPDLDTTTAYVYNTTSVTYEMDATNLSAGGTTWSPTNWTVGPRYYWIDWNMLRVWFNSKFNHHIDANMTHMNSPGLSVSWIRSGWNLFCRSRKRLGVVAPGASSSLTL